MTQDTNNIKIFDTTMRDGEQSPGASMNIEEKIKIARALENLGVDIIEAGFPAASKGDFNAVKEISSIIKNSQVCALSRASQSDIQAAADALKNAAHPRIHTFISTSELHMKHKLQLDPDQVYQKVIDSVSYARNLCDDVEWSCEDGTRTNLDFMCKTVEAAIKNGATTINIPDTVGYSVPEEFTHIITHLINNVSNIDKITLSTHCHNDLGLAVANSLAGVKAGARQIECTINGLGERAGNAALEEVVMAIRTRNDLMPYSTNIITEQLSKTSKLVSAVTGFPVQFNKAIVGKNAFAHEAGIHQDGMLKNAKTYEIMTPESVGVSESNLVMGKHSGRHAFKQKVIELGYNVGDNAIEEAFENFKSLADKKKNLYDEDIAAIIEDQAIRINDNISLIDLQVVAGTKGPQKSTISMEIFGEVKEVTSTGDGPVDAIFNGLSQLVPHSAKLLLYQVHAVTEGTDAQAEVSVRLSEKGKSVVGQGSHTDTLVASAKAYINALNKLIVKRAKTEPKQMSVTS
ncbi:MAG: 2-isopropylmalate synthase [Gammaproteobacteria bacterium]|nr:2-isopropylmalate synthase [Gammaproteobacteria bacterium]|tara:strand:- start:11 stop:1564 length:1554 start_codon:yes stop_codon:yes gene_type:complete